MVGVGTPLGDVTIRDGERSPFKLERAEGKLVAMDMVGSVMTRTGASMVVACCDDGGASTKVT